MSLRELDEVMSAVEFVQVAKSPNVVLYHRMDCHMVDNGQQLRRVHAEGHGFRPADCCFGGADR